MTPEEWCPIPGYEGYYEASNLGRIRSLARLIKITEAKSGTRSFMRRMKGSIRKQVLNTNNGYLHLALSKDGVVTMVTVHQTIALTFHGKRPPGQDVCHNDGDRINCRADNLRYGTKKENFADAIRHGVMLHGERHPRAKLTGPEVLEIRRLFGTMPQIEIARIFGISQGGIRAIGVGRNWKHLLSLERK